MTDTTQPHPEPQEASSLTVVAWLHKLLTENYRETSITSFSEDDPWQDALKEVGHAVTSDALVRLSDAQSQLTALRAEKDAARADAQELRAIASSRGGEIMALKAAPVVDVEAIQREARAEALRNFRHEHGQDFADAKKWREWQEAQRLIEEEMPEGYAVTLVCSPGDWDLRFTDPECDDIRIYDYESTEDFIRTAVAHAKEHVRAAASMAPKETP